MRNYFKTLTVFTTLWASVSFGGSVSGGGGGTTVAQPANPLWIVTSARLDAGPVILAWLNQQEENYNLLSQREKLNSPFHKLFSSKENIFDIVKKTKIEMRMGSPCLDSAGVAKDGSIYASTSDAICISPFTMAPKLNEYNLKQETLALIVHELSHLMGTDEAEAEQIQKVAIGDFFKLDFLNVVVAGNLLVEGSLGGYIHETLSELGNMIGIAGSIRQSDLFRWVDKFIVLRDEYLSYHYQGVLFTRSSRISLGTAQYTRVKALSYYLCANESTGDWKKECEQKLEQGFAGEENITARQFLQQTDASFDSAIYGPEYDEVVLTRVRDTNGVIKELGKIGEYLLDLENEVKSQVKFQFDILRR